MPYPGPQTWTDGSGGGTPISAARLTVMENGIDRGPYGFGISKWGFLAASMHPLATRVTSGYGGLTSGSIALARCIIPANTTVTNIVAGVGTVGAGTAGTGPNGYALYEVSGTTATLAQSSASDVTLWTTVGWRLKALASPVASQSTEREVMLGICISIGTTVPAILANLTVTSALNKTVAGTLIPMSYYITGNTSWPTTIALSTAAQDNGVIFLGVT